MSLLIYSTYSLGLDTYIEDPICKFKITNEGYGRIGRLISEINLRTLFVMEGLVFVIIFIDTPADVRLYAVPEGIIWRLWEKMCTVYCLGSRSKFNSCLVFLKYTVTSYITPGV